jgi:hypothetical protein
MLWQDVGLWATASAVRCSFRDDSDSGYASESGMQRFHIYRQYRFFTLQLRFLPERFGWFALPAAPGLQLRRG